MLRFTTQSLCARAYQPARRYAVSVRAAEAAKAAKKEAPKNDLKITKKELASGARARTHARMRLGSGPARRNGTPPLLVLVQPLRKPTARAARGELARAARPRGRSC